MDRESRKAMLKIRCPRMSGHTWIIRAAARGLGLATPVVGPSARIHGCKQNHVAIRTGVTLINPGNQRPFQEVRNQNSR